MSFSQVFFRAAALFLGASLFMPSPARAEHYDVFIFIGQSNMDGRAQMKDLTGPLAKYAEPQRDVKIDYSCSDLRGPVQGSAGWKPLSPGWSVGTDRHDPDFVMPTETFGPEVGFGRAVADAMPGRHVAIVKFAEGGTSLRHDWNPDVRHRLWDQSLAFIQSALKDLQSNGDTYTIDGIVWHQGESDASQLPGKYAEMLTAFINRLRDELKLPDVPFVIGEVFDNRHRDNVRRGEREVSQSMPNVYFASAANLVTIDHGTHFDAASQIELGKRLADAYVNKTIAGPMPATVPTTVPTTIPATMPATQDSTEPPVQTTQP